MAACRPTRWLVPGMLASAGSYAAAWRFYLPQLRADMPRAAAHVLSVGSAGALVSWGWGAAVMFFDATSPRPVRALGGFGCLAWLGLVNHFARFVARGIASTKELGQTLRGNREINEIAAIVVLGAGLTGDRPSPVLARRLDRALELARELERRDRARVGEQVASGGEHRSEVRGKNFSDRAAYCSDAGGCLKPRYLVVSGGQGEDEQCTESDAMARYLRERARFDHEESTVCAVAENATQRLADWQLIEEDQATSTAENLANSTAELIQLGALGTAGEPGIIGGPRAAEKRETLGEQESSGQRGKPREFSVSGKRISIAVVTSDFHVARTRWHAQRAQNKFPNVMYRVVGAVTPVSARPAAYVREYAANMVQVWIPKLRKALVFPTKRNR